MPKILLLLCVCVFISPFVSALETDNEKSTFNILLNHINYGITEGLSQDTVTAIIEDKEGYIWIGTINGLNRFDGNEFKQFYAANDDNSLPSSFIRNLLLNDSGILLVGTDKGLVEFDRDTESFKRSDISIQIGDQAIWSLSKQNDEIFVGLNNSLISYKKDEKQNENYTNSDVGEIKNVIKLNQELFIRNYDGDIFKINGETIEKIFKNSMEMSLLNGEILIGSNDGIFSFKKSIKKISNVKLTTIEVNSNHKKHLFGIGGNNLYKIYSNGGDLKVSNIGVLDIKKERLSKVFISSGNDIYISNYIDGFFKISEQNNYIKRVNTSDKNIWSITYEKNEITSINNESDLYSYNESFNINNIDKSDLHHGPKSIANVEGKKFIGSSEGLFLVDNKNSKKIINKIIFNIKVFKSKILVSTFDGYVYTLDKHGHILKELNTNTGYPIYDTLLVDNTLWIASQSGLFSYSENNLKQIYNQDFVFNITLNNGTIYFGTRNGLNYLKDGKVTSLVNRKKIIYSITSLGNTITAASNREVIIVDTKTNKTYILTTNNGSFKDYNSQSATVVKNQVLLGSSQGINIIDPINIISKINSSKESTLSLDELFLFNSPVKVGSSKLPKNLNSIDSITLKYSEYPFTIKFNMLGKPNSDYDFFYYLEDLEKNWLSTNGSNSVTYTNLSADEYTLKIYAENKLNGDKTAIKELKIIITPPWWLSSLALGIYTTFFLIIILLIVRSFNKRRQIQKQIAQSEERLKLSLWGSGDEMWDWDIESGKIYRSNIWGSLDFPQDGQRSGTPEEESNIHPLDRQRVTKALNDHFNSLTDHFEIAYRVKARNKQWVWILDRAKIVERDQKDRPLRMTGTIKDINNIKQAEEQLRLFARAIENISEGMFILNEKYQYVEVNEACCELTGSTRENYLNQTLNFNRYPESFSAQIRSILKQQGRWIGEVEASKGANDSFLMELTIDAIYNEEGETSHYVGVFSDITRRKQQEEELRKLTNNDLLTGLPNRSSLQVTLSNLVKKDIHHTLMVLDLDNFKRINDSLGHQIGDDLLIGVAERIKLAIPAHASLYRLGGDEFALLVDQHPDIGTCAAIATQVINCLKPAFNLNNESLVLGISIGIVLYPEDEQDEQALLRKADIAMYHAKSAGGNRYQFYSESLNQNALRQLEIENLIREALKDNLFEVYYQPKIDVKKDRLTGMEALVRLNHPTLGIIGPNEFIPLAEENGLIVEIGDVVLRKACFAAQKWLEAGLFTGRVAVNLSSKQFALIDLQQRIESILRLTKLPAKHLELEITEGTVIKNPEQAIKVMQQLAKMGVSLALDDFGTGYSSLSYLKRFPINCLKIDKTFVDDIDKSDRDLKMVDSIITIAHNMGLSVVGEGVEQTAQLNILKALNCEEIQGYIYSKPIKETEFELMLTADKLKYDALEQTLIKK